MEAQDRLEQRGLAGAVAAQQGHDLARLDRQLADLEHGAHAATAVEAEEARPHPRIGAHLGRAADGDDPAAIEADQAVADARQQLDVVIDDQHAATGVAQAAEDADELARARGRWRRPPARRAAGRPRPWRRRAPDRPTCVSPASASVWKVRPMPARAIACVGSRSMRSSSSAMVPASARSRPLIDVEQRRLARAVGADQARRSRRAPSRQRHVGQRLDAAEALADPVEDAELSGRRPPAATSGRRGGADRRRPRAAQPVDQAGQAFGRPQHDGERGHGIGQQPRALQVAQQLGQADGERGAHTAPIGWRAPPSTTEVRQSTITEKPVASGETTPLSAAEKAPARPASAPPTTKAANRQRPPSMPSVAATSGASRSRRAVSPSRPAKQVGVEQHAGDQAEPDRSPAGRARAAATPAKPASPLAPPVRLSACTATRLTSEASARVASAK